MHFLFKLLNTASVSIPVTLGKVLVFENVLTSIGEKYFSLVV